MAPSDLGPEAVSSISNDTLPDPLQSTQPAICQRPGLGCSQWSVLADHAQCPVSIPSTVKQSLGARTPFHLLFHIKAQLPPGLEGSKCSLSHLWLPLF